MTDSQLGRFAEDCRLIRQVAPVVHNITNYVAMGMSANALLAVGASPLMSSEPDEMEEIATVASSLVINLGCLELRQIEAMKIAACAMQRLGKPWVLDPVGVGVSALRKKTALELIEKYHPTVIRGNASEIIALAGGDGNPRGVDSGDRSDLATDHAVRLAKSYGSVVSVSGETDYITDGDTMVSLLGGSPMMPRVSAMGCTASAITAAFLAVDRDALGAASCAMALMGVAGETASEGCAGPAMLAARFIDMLYSLDPESAAAKIRIV